MGDFVGVPPLFPQGPDPLEMWRNAYSQPSASINDGKVQSLAQTYQADPEYVRDNLIDFQSRFAAQQLYSDTFKNKYPTLSRNLVTSQFVSRVRDDMGNLIETEGWWNEIANGYQISRDTVEIGSFSTRAMLEGRDLYPYERRKIEQRSRLQRAHMQSEPGFLASAAELAGTMQETLAYSLGAGYVAGAVSGPAAPVVAPLAAGITAFATSFNLEAGNLYADLVMDGYTPAQARDIAMKYGAVIAGFATVGTKLAGQPIKQLGRELLKNRGRDILRRETADRVTGKIFKDYALGILGESTAEGFEEVIGEFGKARASQIYRPQNLYEPEYYETFKQAFVHTAKGMVVLGGVPSAIRLVNDNVKVATANYDYEKAKEAAEIRGRSNARDAQRQVDAESGETTTLNSSYYIRAQDFKSALAEAVKKGAVTEKQVRDTIEANSPGLMARIDEAAERDGDVELSKTEWEDAFENTKFRDTALRHTAYEENGLTNFEVKKSEAIRDKIIQERGDKAEQELQDIEEFERQLRDVRQDVIKQLREEMKGMDAAQTLTPSAYASMVVGFIRRAALQQNITPQEFYQKHFPVILQRRLDAKQAQQAQQTRQQTQQQTEQQAETVAESPLHGLQRRYSPTRKEMEARLDAETDAERTRVVQEQDRLYPSQLETVEEVDDRIRENRQVGMSYIENNALGRVRSGVESPRAATSETQRALNESKFNDSEWGANERALKARRAQLAGEQTQQQTEQQQAVANNDDLKGMTKSQLRAEAKKHPGVKRNGKGVTVDSLIQGITEARAAEAQAQQQPQTDTLDSGTFDQDADYTFTESDYRPEVVAWAKEQFGDRVAPNGKPVYQNFVRWFGDSKVVDAEGKPLRVFHGTVEQFEAFEAGEFGFHFGDEAAASMMGDEMEVYLRLTNPLRVRDLGVFNPETVLDQISVDPDVRESVLDETRVLREELSDELSSDDPVVARRAHYKMSQPVRDLLKSEGYDGLVYRNESEGFADSYVAFDPDQIKSTQNEGNFSADPGILYSKETAAAFDESPYNKKAVAWAKNTFGNRVAPNGKPVYQNFLEFFGDSVVMDEQGSPLVMYHGTKSPGFSKFEYRYLMHGLFGVGIYTTENSKVAGGYAGVDPDAKRPKLEKDGGIYPLLISIKNPIDMDAEPDLDKWRAAFPDVEFPDGIEKNEYAYRHVEDFYGIRSEAVGWRTRGAAKPFLARSEKRQAPSARDINEGKSSSPDILRLATEIRELQKKGNRIHRRQKKKARSLLDDMGFKRAGYPLTSYTKKYDERVEIVSSELLQYSWRRPNDASDYPNIPSYMDTYKVEYVDPYFGRQTVVVGAIDSMEPSVRLAVETDLGQRMLGAFGASIDVEQADNPYSLANGSYPFEGMRLEGEALNKVTDAMREAQEAQFELDELSESVAEKENELESLRLTDEGQDITELVQNGLIRMGHDGITHLGGGRVADERHRVYVAFEPNQIKSFYNQGDFSADPNVLFSKEGDQKRVLGQAEVEGGNAIRKILLDPNAKPTTLMHELMHWNMEIMATVGLDIESKLAQEGYEATALEAQMLDDVKRLLKWSGFKGTLAEWRAMTIDQRREFHEAIAVSFERYLYEGVAPSRELRGAFRRLLDYMRGKFEDLVLGYQRDYEREFGRELPGMNDEVRAIFGRMMSAERDVQAFFDESELDAMLMTREEWVNSGRSAEEYDEYDQEFKDAMHESKAELTQRRMKEVGTFTRAYELVARKQRAELNRIRKQIRQEVEAEVRLQPVYQLRSWMRNQTYQTSSGLFEDSQEYTSRKLNTAMVEAVSPDLAKRLKARKMVSKDGMSLDSLRTMFGFESNEAMLQALADSRNFADEITHRTDQRLLNEHTDLMDPVVQQENIHAAVHNKIREKVMARELKFLLNNGRSNRVEMRAMADAAKQIIESTPTGDVDIAAYSRAAARARKKMLKALKDGDMEAAKFAKRQEMLNEALVREGMKVRTEVRSLVKMNKRVFNKRSDKALAEAGYDVTVVKAIRALLTRLGIGNVDFDPAQALNAFRNEDPEFFDEVSGDIDYFLRMDIAQPRVGDRRRPMEHLLVGDVRKLRSLSRRMMKRARDKMSAKIGERKENIETLRQEAQATMESNVKVKRDADDKSIFGMIRDYFSNVIRFEHLFRRIDGGKAGIWTQMFRQVKDAANKYRQELRQFLAKDAKTGEGFDFEGKIRALDLKIPGGARSLTMNLPSAGKSGRSITIGRNGKHVKTELIHLAMHYYGNSSNRRRLAAGYAGLDATPDQIRQVAIEIKRFLDEQVSQGVLTRKDFAFMQSIFDHFSGQDMLGRAQKVMKDLRGYEMTEVKGEEFDIQFPGQSEPTTFAGGYIPIRFREAVSQEDKGQGVTEEDASLEQQARRMLGFLPSFTKERVTGDVDRELYLGLHQLASHAAEVYRFINMAQPIDSVSRVLSGRSLEQSFRARFGDNAYNNLQGWLKRSAFQRFERGQDSGAGSLLLRLSRNANMSIMFLNIGNTLQNYAGLLIPMRRVGKRRLISSLIHSTFNRKLSDAVAAKSPEMKARLKRQIFDIYNTQNQILTSEDSAWRRLQSWADKYAYVLQQITQNHVDVAVWQAAYNQETEAALKENVSAEAAEARAIAHADSVVRQSQMAGEKEDLSAFESGGSLARAIFPFKSWFINWLNNAATQNRLDMKQEDRSRAAAVASTYIYMLMLPAMMAQAVVELAKGDDFDDEDDGFGDDLTELFFRSQIDQVTGGMPVVGDVSRLAINNWLDDEYWNNRYPVAPWMRALERLVQTPLKFGEEPAGTTLDMAAQMASIMGVPASGAFRRLSLIGDEIAGELESESTYDFFRGAVTGQRSDLQRLSQ